MASSCEYSNENCGSTAKIEEFLDYLKENSQQGFSSMELVTQD
jgi:hypothetical protein